MPRVENEVSVKRIQTLTGVPDVGKRCRFARLLQANFGVFEQTAQHLQCPTIPHTFCTQAQYHHHEAEFQIQKSNSSWISDSDPPFFFTPMNIPSGKKLGSCQNGLCNAGCGMFIATNPTSLLDPCLACQCFASQHLEKDDIVRFCKVSNDLLLTNRATTATP